MNIKYFYTALILMLICTSQVFPGTEEDLQTIKLTGDRMKFFPVPADNINYFFMQSIDSDTAILIGDFSGPEKKIILINDKNNDNTIDSVMEYYPFKKAFRKKSDSKSSFFTKDIAKLKKDIIDGTVYKGNYTDDMKSLSILESLVRNPDNNSLSADVYGFSVKLFEADEMHKNSALFCYGKSAGGYYLQFKTEYYRKAFNTVQIPTLKYSVFCKNSNDQIVMETVENLFKVRQPRVNSIKGDSIQKSK